MAKFVVEVANGYVCFDLACPKYFNVTLDRSRAYACSETQARMIESNIRRHCAESMHVKAVPAAT